MWWLFTRLVRRPLRRILLGAIGVAFPVAMLGAMLLFVDVAVQSMTAVALQDVQVEMRALASSLTVDMAAADAQIATVPGVRRVDRFASADVVVSADGAAPTPARLFAVDPVYAQDHPEVKVTSGALEAGALLAEPLRALPGFASATTISIALPAAPPPPPPPPSPTPPTDEEAAPEPPPPPPWSMTMPVGGTADLRQASTWYAVPSGEAQGDVALVPRALIMDYNSFESTVLPALRNAAAGDASWAFNPGATDLPQASVEAHVTIDHAAYPVDPAEAIAWSNKIRRVMERQAAGALIVTDDAAEALTSAKEDATNAKILFLLLGVPGVLVGAGLGLAAAGALAESQRREQALLQLRGATSGQLLALTTAEAVLTGIIGAALGLVAAAAAVGAVTGQPVWEQVPVERLRVSAAIAVAAGILTTATRMVRVLRSSRRHAEVASERSRLESGWDPGWKRARLDLVALGVGVLILGVNVFAGGLKQTPIEGQTLALAFYVLLAPIALWLGATLLIVRGVFALLTRRARAGRANGLRSWPGTAVRWLGRRPARTAAALVLTALAVAFGTTVAAFTDTYRVARTNDQVSALGSDLRLTPPVDAPGAPPPITGVAATSPVWEVPARVGNDRKTISALDVASYRQAATAPAHMLSGEAVAALDGDPAAVLINKELADGFSVGPGDFLPVTIFPDDPSRVLILNLRVVGVFRSVAPMEPFAELFMPTSSFPAPLPPPDFYLARVAPGSSTAAVAEEARRQLPTYTVTTLRTLRISQERALTALNVRTLGRLQIVAAGLVAAVGVAVLGAFLVLERRRESIILRTVGASTGQVVTAPVVEGAIAALGGLAIGIPVGLFLGALNIQILALFFTLPPPLLVVSGREVAALAAVVVLASVLALAVALTRVAHQSAASVLRDV